MSYIIAGKAIKNEYLALGTLISAIGATVALSGGDKKDASSSKPVPVAEDKSISADSKDELDFIRQFVADGEKEGSH